MVQRLGDRLWQEGYKGVFCVDFLIDTDDHDVYLGEINPRISGASPPTNLITTTYGGCPLFLFHLLEFMDVDWELDLAAGAGSAGADYDDLEPAHPQADRGQGRAHHQGAAVRHLAHEPATATSSFVRRRPSSRALATSSEAFYLRVYGVGQYRYHGADLGILITHGRMQTDDRRLTDRAKLWNAGIKAQFEGIPPPPAAPKLPAQWPWGKLF